MKQRALLALLLLHANRVVSRDSLIDELWDGAPPDTAATALQVYVSQLRKSLGRDTIVTRAPGYLVVVESGALDIERFERLVAEARGQQPAAAAKLLQEALALWRGPALADLDDSLARHERAQLEDQRAAALDHRIAADLELGIHAELVPELEALVREEPLRERRRAQLMLALYRSGRQADALEVYQRGRRLLAEDLGLDPGDELRQLEKAILEHDASLAAPVAAPQPDPEEQELTVAERAGQAEERRLRLLAHSRWALALGALLFAGALAAVVIVITRGSASSVAVLANSVAVLDPRSGRIIADVPIGGRPVSIALGAGAVWVVNADDETVLRIDPKTKRVVKTIGGLGTDLTSIAFGSGSVWVAGGNDGTVVRIDPRQNAAEAPVDLGSSSEVLPQPVFLLATGAGGVWLTRGNRLLRIDPRTNAVTANVRADHTTGLVAEAGGVWATRLDEHVLRFDARIATVTAARDLSVAANFPRVYAGSLWLVVYVDPPQIWRLNPSTLTLAAPTSLPKGFPFGLASGDGALWTADHDHGTVWRIDAGTGQATMLARIGQHPVAIAEGAGAVWVGVQAQPL